ncbi:MAG: J domain-containing protein [Thermodesulfobacteria bacterium]|nr:J domain-containing protein [Thermodesulfobacteriota bacterium]
MKSFDPYQVLGIKPEAGLAEIRRAFREKARLLHPDAGGEVERFLELKRSYEILCARHSPQRLRLVRERPSGGNYLLTFLDVTVRELALGATVTVVVPDRPLRCPRCQGRGVDPEGKRETCPSCAGEGRLAFDSRRRRYEIACPRCGGEGYLLVETCPTCRGRGELPQEKEMALRIPLGARPGDLLYLPAGPDGPVIDVYFELQVHNQEDLFFEEDRLVSLVQVPFWQAALGGKILINTLEGEEWIVIPRGLNQGFSMVLKQRGAYLEDGSREDLFVRFKIVFPEELPDEVERLLLKIAQIMEKKEDSHELAR